MPSAQPLWRRTVDSLDARIGPRANAVVSSEAFKIAVGLGGRTRHAVQQRMERNIRRVLHFWNLPAGSDVTRLLAELGRLRQEVRELDRDLNARREEERPHGAARSTPKRPRARAS